jgi:hypothetical protein
MDLLGFKLVERELKTVFGVRRHRLPYNFGSKEIIYGRPRRVI